MSKDPAVLFYSSDFLTGTMTMTNEHVGMYIRLLCLQHQKGKLTEKDMLYICSSYVEDVFCKFVRDISGMYFNQRMYDEASKRAKYSESRSKNVSKRYQKSKATYVEHMENENENISAFDFNSIWIKYPRRTGRKKALACFKSSVKTEEDFINIQKALDNYISSKRVFSGFVQAGSTWFNNWRDWIDYKEDFCPKCKDKGTFISSSGYTIRCECPAGKRAK